MTPSPDSFILFNIWPQPSANLYTDHELGQMLNYLKITGHPLGLILNFRRARLEWRRVINTNRTEKNRG